MSKTTDPRARLSEPEFNGEFVSRTSETVALDSRNPVSLDRSERAMLVRKGFVDLFAIPTKGSDLREARHHLFRVEAGAVVFGLSTSPQASLQPLDIIAVGSAGAEALVFPREDIKSVSLITPWMTSLAAIVVRASGDWAVEEAQPETSVTIDSGNRVRAPMRGLVWASVETGVVRLMNLNLEVGPSNPPVALASGMWIESVLDSTTVRFSVSAPEGAVLWHALDTFHANIRNLIYSQLQSAAETDATRLLQHASLADESRQSIFNSLASLFAKSSSQNPPGQEALDPLFAACSAVATAMRTVVSRPPDRVSGRQGFGDILQIVQFSRLRARQVLLRGDWWRQDVGALIGWHGAGRSPVALLPAHRNRYLMVEPLSGQRHVVDQKIASQLAPDAVTLYVPLPSRTLSLRDMLVFGLRQARGNFPKVLFAMVLAGLLSLVPPLMVNVIVDSAIPRTELDQLTFCAAALVMTAFGMAGLQMFQGMALLRLEGLLDWKLQAGVVDRFLRLPASLFREYTVGDLSDRTLGIDAIRRIATGRVLRGLFASVLGCFSFLLMIYYDAALALVAIALAAIRVVYIIVGSAVRLRHERRHFELQGKVQGFVLQLLTGVGKLRVAGATSQALAVWASRFSAQKVHFVRSQRAANIQGVFESAFPTIATLVIFAMTGGNSSVGQDFDLGAFLGFFVAFGQSLSAVGEWASAVGTALIAIPRALRVKPLLNTPVEKFDDRRLSNELSGSVELSRITFRYASGGRPVLENLTLRVAAGEYVAIVGPSGGGKSTLFRLLLGFETPEAGAVFFDGKALDTIDLGSLPRQLGVVLQDGKLVTGSIYQNICGGAELPEDQVWAAARLAGLEDDIKALPMGMHTLICEGVNTLSGGQRQRLMIARALVRHPRILLFDEATSSLDNQAQSVVSASLSKLSATRIVVAHRLSTVRDAHRIVVLLDGKIVQSGTFAELTSTPGPFADLAQRQLL
jgi:NHLM bacteriocin system ABC transporter ATP-binding protein